MSNAITFQAGDDVISSSLLFWSNYPTPCLIRVYENEWRTFLTRKSFLKMAEPMTGQFAISDNCKYSVILDTETLSFIIYQPL